MPNIQFFNYVINSSSSAVHLRVVKYDEKTWGVDVAVDSEDGDERLDEVVSLVDDAETPKEAVLAAWVVLREFADRTSELIAVLGGFPDIDESEV